MRALPEKISHSAVVLDASLRSSMTSPQFLSFRTVGRNLLFAFFRDPLTMPPFRDPHGMSIAHATCDHSLSALSNPADFVALLARDDIVRGAFGGHSGTAPTAGKATRLCIYLTLYNGKNLLLGLLCKCLDLLGLLYKPVGSLAVLESGSVNLDVETCTHHRRACC